MTDYFVYIMTNDSRTLYIGVTNDLQRRVAEHQAKATPSFTSRYNVTQLVHFESTTSRESAIAREKQLKGWTRKRKMDLIESANPQWLDLSIHRDPAREILPSAQDDAGGVAHEAQGANR